MATHEIDTVRLARYIRDNVADFSGTLSLDRFRGGQSNPTYKVTAGNAAWVMRCKPGPSARLLPSAHAVEREFRVQAALAGSGFPVPKVLSLCVDESVIGRVFYLMEHVDGRIFWKPTLDEVARSDRPAIYAEMNRVMALLHSIDYTAAGLGDYGKAGSYFLRQASRWSRQYRASETERVEAMDRLIEWLPDNAPRDEITSIIHGDYRLANVIFERDKARIAAVLDWELSTLGDPLADFAYNCVSYYVPSVSLNGLADKDLEALNIPSVAEYRKQYEAHVGRRCGEHWTKYIALNLFRMAAIAQGIKKRRADGLETDARAEEIASRVTALAETAWRLVDRGG